MITLTFASTFATCPLTNDGSASVIASGGTAPYTYQWDDFYSQTTPIALNLISATYTVYVKDATGEMVSGTIFVPFTSRVCPEPPPADPAFPGDTVAFSKTRNRWITRYSFNPEYFGSIRNEIVSFVDGQLYLHGINPIYNNFYDLQFDSTVTFPTNKIPLKVKYFTAIAESSNSVWDVPAMTVAPSLQYPLGLSSFLPAEKFRVIQGKYYSEILRDVNTPGFPTTSDSLLNGRPMTGQAMTITLHNSDFTEAVLLSIEVVYTYSEKS